MRGAVPLILLSALAALAPACSRPQTKGQTPIAEADIPQARAGLWRGDVQVEGEQPVSSTFCAAAHPVVQPRIGKCSRYEVVRTAAGAIESDSTCVDTDGATWVLHGVVVGDPNTAFTQDGTMKIYARGAASPRVINGHMSFRYLGACPPGAKPTPGP